MGDYDGFWSYVRKDDEAEKGRISQLAHDVVAQFELLTGETIRLFLDRNVLEWGEDWKQRIEEELSSVAFFIPVITPRYFLSVSCREELEVFLRKSKERGTPDIVLPLLYAGVPAFLEQAPVDDLIRLVKERQWIDWTTLRLAEIGSSEYRTAVARLAQRIADVNRAAEAAHGADGAILGGVTIADEEAAPGILDIIADAEEALPQLNHTTQEITAELNRFGAAAGALQTDVEQARQNSMGDKILLARKFAATISGPAGQIERLGTQFVSQLHRVDDGILQLVGLVESQEKPSEHDLKAACEFFTAIRALASTTRDALQGIDAMVKTTKPMELMSRDLRPPLRRLRVGLTGLLQAREVMENWEKRLAEANLDCDARAGAAA